MAPDTWLRDFVTFELETLWRRRHKVSEPASKHFHDPLLRFANRRAKKKNGGQGYVVCCEIPKQQSYRPTLYPIEFLDRSDIVSATFSDTGWVKINGKFSSRAEVSHSQSHSGDLKAISPGTRLCLNNFELHVTDLGDKDWNISLLINEFGLIGIEKDAVLRGIPFVKSAAIEDTLRKLLSSNLSTTDEKIKTSIVRKSNSPKPDAATEFPDAAHEYDTRDTEVVEIDSDVASQDHSHGNSPDHSSQIGLSMQTQLQDVNVSSGVNLAGPQEPRRKGLVESNGTKAANSSNRNQQLLEMLKGHKSAQATKAVAEQYITDLSETQNGDVAVTRILKAADQPSSEISRIAETYRSDTVLPVLPRTQASTRSHTEQAGYSSAHQGDFEFVNQVQSIFNGPDREQDELLRKPGSWNYPEPGHKFPGLNVPIDILSYLTSRKKSPEADEDTVMTEADSDNIIGAVPYKIQPEVKPIGRFEDHESSNESPEPTPLPWSDSPQPEPTIDPETESLSMPSSPPALEVSSPFRDSLIRRGEPRDSSLELGGTCPETATIRSNKRVGTPPTPSTSGIKRIRPSSAPYVEGPAAMARQAKREFVAARRRLKNEHSSTNFMRPEDVNEKERKTLSDGHDSSVRKLPSSPITHPLSQQSMVLQIRSPEVPRAKSSTSDDHTIQVSKALSQLATNPQEPAENSVSYGPIKELSLIPASSLMQDAETPHSLASLSTNQNESCSVQSMSLEVSKDLKSMSKESTYIINSTQSSRSNDKGKDSISPTYHSMNNHENQSDIKFIVKRQSPNRYRSNRIDDHSPGLDSYTQVTVESVSSKSNALGENTQDQHNEWWKTEDTAFKRFFRDYASLKVFDGVLGVPTTSGSQVLTATERHIDVLSWRI